MANSLKDELKALAIQAYRENAMHLHALAARMPDCTEAKILRALADIQHSIADFLRRES